ncbi:aldehyde dehydrogenase family protein [Kordiimonas sp. SCSIO 12603]|uniref:aldehyde dehydrogenase family protein n=1 Tax=Kordiimonas sp. SCSIO 12603 TaxID=2829596 RepID=UPI00210820C3|nr:aldehyde dehydrogenase family protein [Kordiimonas sp. SCSIO 12603]UTW60207.1 aldehyde dehydrogenase family protein [Kordiimonas sp. SCSIO 12603]
MRLPDATRFYIGGEWVSPEGKDFGDVVNPATEQVVAKVAYGNQNDVDKAVAAAKAAFPSFARTSIAERKELISAINAKLIERNEDIAFAIHQEMGAPMALARGAQAPSGPQHFEQILKELESYSFSEKLGTTTVRHEPIGVVGMITPWNWPMNQIATKVAPAIAAGCTMVLKPSELAPLDAIILAEIIDVVGLPEGVFNLVHGDGIGVGAPLTAHKDVDMVSFTGSTRAGIAISEAAAPTIKRVSLELGGKSAAIICPSAPIEEAVASTIKDLMLNSGQSCNARARILVHKVDYKTAAKIAAETASEMTCSASDTSDLGPMANNAQYRKVRDLIQIGIEEGATLLAGGCQSAFTPENGYFIPATVFGGVTPDMTIAREEIFGPVATLMAYESIEEAIKIANDSEYGLSGAVWAGTTKEAAEIASELRTGMVHLNGAGLDSAAPFGGFRMSGNGREWGKHGLEEFLEVKSVYGANQ